MDNLRVLEGNKKIAEFQKHISHMKTNLELYFEYQGILAQITRKKFLYLKDQGFSDQEALELCKKVL